MHNKYWGAGTLHGSGYFELLDDAAFFAAQAHNKDNFVYTTSFTLYMVRPLFACLDLSACLSVLCAHITHRNMQNYGRSRPRCP